MRLECGTERSRGQRGGSSRRSAVGSGAAVKIRKMRVRHADAEVPALFCSYHARVPGSPSEEAPLIVVQITNFRLNELFSCEIIRVDPCGKFALDPRGRELVARVEHLLGARFPTLSQACQTFFKAYTGDPRAKTDYMENFRAYIEPLDPPRFDAKRLASCARNVALHGGVESAFTRFSPDLVETPVIVHPIKPRQARARAVDRRRPRPAVRAVGHAAARGHPRDGAPARKGAPLARIRRPSRARS